MMAVLLVLLSLRFLGFLRVLRTRLALRMFTHRGGVLSEQHFGRCDISVLLVFGFCLFDLLVSHCRSLQSYVGDVQAAQRIQGVVSDMCELTRLCSRRAGLKWMHPTSSRLSLPRVIIDYQSLMHPTTPLPDNLPAFQEPLVQRHRRHNRLAGSVRRSELSFNPTTST